MSHLREAEHKRYFVQASGSPFWLSLMSGLSDSHLPTLVLVDDRLADQIEETYPTARVLRANDLKHGLFRRTDCVPMPPELRESELFSRRFGQALYSLERLSVGGEIDFPRRQVLLSSLTDFLWGEFIKCDPDFGIMTESPHTLSDLILTGIAECLGKPILHFQQNGFIPTVRPVVGPECLPIDLNSLLSPGQEAIRQTQIANFRSRYLDFVQGAASRSLAQFESAVSDLDVAVFSGWKAPWRRFYVPYAWLDEERQQVRLAMQRGEIGEEEFWHSSHGLTAKETVITLGRRSLRLCVRQSRQIRKLRESLESHAVEIPSGKFVAMFLSFEPEKTSVPDGGVFGDQVFAIRSLAGALGGKMPLVVREHPSQLTMAKRGFRVRRNEFYEEIASIPNVHLIKARVSRDEIFAGAAAVVTLTGTVGVESWLQGIPVILLGRTWYSGLEGICSLDKYSSLPECVEDALSVTPKVVGDRIEVLWRYIESSSIVNVLNPYFDKSHGQVTDDTSSLVAVVRGLFG